MPDSAFDAWYNEIEGFALRAERLTAPKDELMAAFEAGAVAAWDRATAAERERAAKVAEGFVCMECEIADDIAAAIRPPLNNRLNYSPNGAEMLCLSRM